LCAAKWLKRLVETLSGVIYTLRTLSGQDGLSGLRDGPILSEAGIIVCPPLLIEQPPRLIDINQGGHFKAPASVNRFLRGGFFVTASVNKNDHLG
jgi:hypothetical protein